MKGDDEITRLLAGLLDGVDNDDVGAGDGFGVKLALVGVIRADGIDVHSVRQIGAEDYGL